MIRNQNYSMNKIALVHDYLNEFGGAERVLEVLSDMFPDAPIYTAFSVPGSSAADAFTNKKVISSWFQNIPLYKKLYSPLRFLIPWIWGSFDFANYDLVISSASWYVTKGFNAKAEICYCHTPPRWLYGYPTSINFQKYWLVRVYGLIVGHFLRMYDFKQSQKVTQFVANSHEVAKRINKLYRRKSIVIYPPVQIANLPAGRQVTKKDYYLIVSRIVGGKGIELAVQAAKVAGFKLIIAGEVAGFKRIEGIESLGRVSEQEKIKLMTEAKGFLALEEMPDFGITPVESMLCGTPVIAFNGGGYKESVVHSKTGILFNDYSVEGLTKAIKVFEETKFSEKEIKGYATKFSKERFESEMLELVKLYA
jgi:glycosyltransferase involved in cell wall biosynthesis